MSDFGLTPDELEILRALVVRPLTKRGAKIWCFGSRALGKNSKFSDIDLMVESSEDLSQLIGEVHEKIVESSFPYKVDLVEWKNFAHEYRANFEHEKKLILP